MPNRMSKIVTNRPKLYVDGLNFFRLTFPQNLEWWNLPQFLLNVRKMVKRLQAYDVKVLSSV
jgi:hypothetical protein